jgi:hypothetical protein
MSLRKAIQRRLDNPALLRAFHGWATLLWVAVGLPMTVVYPDSIFWVAMMSVWANVVGHWGAWQAARAETKESSP